MYTDTHTAAQEQQGSTHALIIIPLRTQGHYRAFKTLYTLGASQTKAFKRNVFLFKNSEKTLKKRKKHPEND